MAPLTTFTSIETPSVSNLKLLIDNWDTLLVSNQIALTKSDKNGETYNPLPKLREYYASAKHFEGKVKVSYHHSSRAKILGRQFVRGGCGLQSFSRKIRHTLVGESFRDYDIKNAHPTLLAQYCGKNDIPCPRLQNYVKAREAHLENLPELTRDEGKDVVLSVMNGGSKLYNDLKVKPDWIRQFKNEIENILALILEKNPALGSAVKTEKETNISGSVMNHLMCDLENNCLVKAIEYLKLTQIPIEYAVLMFDGFMLPKECEVDLSALSKYVADKTGYVVEFVEKPMTEALDLTGFKAKEEDYPFTEFEKAHFKCMNPLTFVRETEMGIQMLCASDLKTMYGNVPDLDKYNTFIGGWLKEPRMRTFEKMDFLPAPVVCPSNTYNLWKGFPVPDGEGGSADLGVKHIRKLIPNTHEAEWFITWLARIVQQAGNKTGICPILIGGQGAGKGFVLEILMAKLMGEYFFHTSDPKTDLFGKNAEACNKRILVNLDDFNVGDVKMMNDTFKSLITGETIGYEAKYQTKLTLRNNTNFVITTNNKNPVKIEADDRRFAVIDCAKELVGKHDYFDSLHKWVADPSNVRAFYEYLFAYDTTKIDLKRQRPMNERYLNIQLQSQSKEDMFLADWITGTSPNILSASAFYEAYRDWIRENGFTEYKPKDAKKIGQWIREIEGFKVSRGASGMMYCVQEKVKVLKYLTDLGIVRNGVCLI